MAKSAIFPQLFFEYCYIQMKKALKQLIMLIFINKCGKWYRCIVHCSVVS